MEKKNVLEVVVDNASWVDAKYTMDYDSIPRDELGHGAWYLHGELESLVGYDIAYATNCKTAGYSRQTINYSCISGSKVCELREDGNLMRYEMHLDGIVPVKVKGVEERCVGYFWTVELTDAQYEGVSYTIYEQRGLVCLESDKEGREYALSAFKERRNHL